MDDRQLPQSLEGRSMASGESSVVVSVRHAQDIEGDADDHFEVRVRCLRGPADEAELSFDSSISVPSGRLSLGDAEEQAILAVSPGRWRIQVLTIPADHPEQVHMADTRRAILSAWPSAEVPFSDASAARGAGPISSTLAVVNQA
jgi:hypothetical protein